MRELARLGCRAAVVTVATWLLALPAGGATRNVSATSDDTFSPATITIRPGDTVVWTNNGGVGHTVTSSSKNWSKDDSIGVPTQTTSYLFEDPGTYRYYCTTHGTPTSGMRGSVVVKARTQPSPSPTPEPTGTPSPEPTPTPTEPSGSPSVEPTGSASPGTSESPAPTASPSVVVPPSGTPLPPPTPIGSQPPGQPVDLGSGGLTPPPPTGRGEGLPALVALVLIGGVGSAEIRAVLAERP